MISHILQVGGLLFLGGLFGLSLVHKLRDLQRFMSVLRSYFNDVRWFGTRLQFLLAVLVIAWEAVIVIAVAIALRDSATAVVAGLLSAGMLLIYGAAMAVTLRRGNAMLDCGCSWGEQRTPVSLLLVVRNLVLAGLSCGLFMFPVDPVPFGSLDTVNAIAIASLAYLLYLAADQLILNQSTNPEVPR